MATGNVSRDSGYGAEALPLWSHLIERFRAARDDSRLQGCLGNQAPILKATSELDGAMRLLNEQEAICRRLNDPRRIATRPGQRGAILKDTGDLDGAMRLLKEVEAICRRLNDPNGLAISLINQAWLLAFQLSRPKDGLPLAKEAARIAAKHGLRALAQQIEPIVMPIRDLVHGPPPRGGYVRDASR